MPDLHMSFFTPSDILRLEKEVDTFARRIRRIIDLRKDPYRMFVINISREKDGDDWILTVPAAGWWKENYEPVETTHFFKGDVIHAPSNMKNYDFMELFFLKVCHALGGVINLKACGSGAAFYEQVERPRVVLELYEPFPGS